MEWVVGQWVEAWGRIWRIIETEKTRSKLDGNVQPSWWCNHGEMKPFQWQVGKTYRTTLEGVTATIKANDVGGVRGVCEGVRSFWDRKTGAIVGYADPENCPHLLPFLADEPSEPEPTLTERYTVEQSGDSWLIRDHQDGRVALFLTQDAAEYAIGMIKDGENVFSWSSADAATQPQQGERDKQPTSRYHRTIKGVVVDLYDIAEAYGVTGHAEFHALKKIIMAGNRGYKDREQDLAEAIVSIERARELSKGGAE